jgi:hypothetical protein
LQPFGTKFNGTCRSGASVPKRAIHKIELFGEHNGLSNMVLPIILLVSFGVAGAALAARTTIAIVNKHGGFKQTISHYQHQIRGERRTRINVDRKVDQNAAPDAVDEHFVGGFEPEMNLTEACLILGLSEKYALILDRCLSLRFSLLCY